MNPRARRVTLVLLCCLLLCGLIVCGPAHHALHGSLHASDAGSGDGLVCDACGLSSLEAPLGFTLCGPIAFVRDAFVVVPRGGSAPVPSSDRAPRGPPSAL